MCVDTVYILRKESFDPPDFSNHFSGPSRATSNNSKLFSSNVKCNCNHTKSHDGCQETKFRGRSRSWKEFSDEGKFQYVPARIGNKLLYEDNYSTLRIHRGNCTYNKNVVIITRYGFEYVQFSLFLTVF